MASQKNISVGYHGTEGALTEGAAKELFTHNPTFANKGFETVPFTTYGQLFEAVAAGKVDQAILPIENSHTGTIQQLLDELVASKLHIIGEYQYSEPLCLLGAPGSSIESITEVASHPAIVDQAKPFLVEKYGGKLQLRIGQNSGTCAKELKSSGNTSSAVIGGLRAAQIYGLNILAKDVAGSQPPVTRYLMVAANPVVPDRTSEPKTSLAVVLKNSPGAFFKATGCFALRDINITKIETRPTKAGIRSAHPWEYILFIDVDGAPSSDKGVAKAIDQLKEFAVSVEVLGSYPKYQSPVDKPMGQFGIIGM